MTDDLELLRSEWQQLTAELPRDLVERATALSRAQLRAAAGEVLGALGLVVFCVWLLLRHPLPPIVGFAMAACLFVGVWLTYFFTIRVGSWGDAGVSLREFTARTRRLYAIELQWARFARASMIVLSAFLAVWSPWLVASRWELYRAAPWRGVVGFGIAACILGLVWMANRRKLARAQANLAEFEARAHAFDE